MKLSKLKKIDAGLKGIDFKELPLEYLKDLGKKVSGAIKELEKEAKPKKEEKPKKEAEAKKDEK